jgi:hypothetical protein
MSTLRALLLVSTLLPIAACSGADGVASPGEGVLVVPPPTPSPPTTPTPPPTPPGTPAAACPQIEGVTDAGVTGNFRACRLPSLMTTDRTLPKVAGIAYMIDGRVDVGVDLGGSVTPNATGRSAILTIEPGVILFGNGGDASFDFLVVNRGSRIQAVGTPSQPIIFTARENLLGTATDSSQNLWGGLVLAGRAPVSDCDANVSTSLVGGSAGCARVVEGTGNVIFGGEVANDTSGSVRYVQIRYSGAVLSPNNELQGLTTGGAGANTALDHIHVHNSGDDGIESFGGRNNMRYLAITGADDDDLDVDNGYQGSVQFVLGYKRTGNGSSNPRNLEVDTAASTQPADSTPRTTLRLSNFTFFNPLTSFPNDTMIIHGGADASLVNGIVASAGTNCLDIDDAATARAATNDPDPGSTNDAPDRGPPVFHSLFFQCASAAAEDANVTRAQVEAILNAGTNVILAGQNALASGYFPGAGASGVPAFNIAALNAQAGDSFLQQVGFIGAVSTANQAEFQGWTCSSGYISFGGGSGSCTSLPAN